MRKHHGLLISTLAAALLTACGGGSGGGSLTTGNAGGVTRLVTFGDSLSDPGAYALAAVEKGGGRFTINGPGARVWTEFLAADYGVSLLPNQYITDNGAQTNANGTSYAEGGARTNPRSTSPLELSGVSVFPSADRVIGILASPTAGTATANCTGTGLFFSRYGLDPNAPTLGIDSNNPSNLAGCVVGTDLALTSAQRIALNDDAGNGFFASTDASAPAVVLNSDPTGAPGNTTTQFARTGLTTKPISKQVNSFLVSNPTGDTSTLITYLGGANDLLILGSAVAAGLPLANAQALARAIAVEVGKQIKSLQQAGYSKIAVGNLPDLGKTPLATSQGASGQALFTALSSAYNDTLTKCLNNDTTAAGCPGVVTGGFTFDASRLLQIDVKALFDDLTADLTRASGSKVYGLSTAGPACNVTKTNNVNGGTFTGFSASVRFPNKTTTSSLFCNSSDLVASGVDQIAIFADAVHPTPKVHSIFANTVLTALRNKGWR